MNNTIALIEKTPEGNFAVFTPDIDSVIYGEGATAAEAKADFLNSYEEMVRFAKEDNEELPESLQELTFTFKYDLSSLFNHYNFINVTKLAEYIGMSPGLMRQYKQGNTYISEQQTLRIEQAIHAIGNEFSAVNLV